MKINFKSLAIAIALSAVIPVYGQEKFNSNKSVCEEEAVAMASKSEADQMDWMQCVSEGQEADAPNTLTSTVRVRLVAQSSQKNQDKKCDEQSNSSSTTTSGKKEVVAK